MTASARGPVVRARGEGEARWFYGGGVHVWKATAADTGGAFLLFEDVMSEGKLTPWHRHPEIDETLYVLEGEILVHADGKEHRIGEGGVVVVPRGVPHAFMVTSKTARLLCLQTPGTGEAFFREASESAAADAGPVDFARVGAAAERSGATEILGPPPFKKG
jgi:quercetin dioxygenase-like cupin family protein